MSWQIIEGSDPAAESEATVVVSGADDRAAATVMALLRELGWAAPEVRYPAWIDEALQATISAGDAKPIRALVRKRYRQTPRWLLRAAPGSEAQAPIAPLLLGVRYVLVVADADRVQDAASPGNDTEAALSAEPAWVRGGVLSGAAALFVSASSVLGDTARLVEVLAAFVGQNDPARIACASSWARQFEGFPDMPLGGFKVNGTIGRATTRSCSGWVYIEGVEAPVELEISVNGYSAVVPAGLPRPDLLTRGFHPSGNCGFQHSFPAGQTIAEGDLIRVRVIGDSRELINSPAAAQSPDSPIAQQVPPAVLLGEIAPEAKERPPIEMPNFPRHKPRAPTRIFLTTLWALMLREMRARFGTKRGAAVWGILEPLAQVVILTIIFKGLKGRFNGTIYGVDAAYFFMLGLLPYRMFSQAVSNSRVKAGAGLYNFRQIRPMDLGLVNAIMEFTIYGVVTMILLALANWFGYPYTIFKPLTFLYCLFLLFWMGFAIGLFFDVLAVIFPVARFVSSVFLSFLFLTSGVVFSIRSLPPVIKQYLLWNPMLHIIDRIRDSAIGAFPSRGDLGYAAICTVAFLFIALAFYRRNLFRLFG